MEAWDVVVVGFGYAGGVAALEAHDAGARVLLLEKNPDPGGISVCSAGGVRIAFDAEKAFTYLQATNGGTAPDALLRKLAQGMVELPDYLGTIAGAAGARLVVRRAFANYPFPGHDGFGFATIEDIEAEFPQVKGSPAGARLFKVVEENVRRRGIDVRLGSRARRLLRTGTGTGAGAIEAVELDTGERLRVGRGVVLAAGGFEADEEMKRQFWQGKPVLTAAYRGNTGDGIRMAQSLGAALWHMWHYHGSYGFRHPDPSYPFGIRTKRVPDWLPGEGPAEDVKLPWILLDREGKRFMNEYEPYLQDTGHRPFERFRPETQDYPRIPAFLVADEEGRKLYPFGRPTYNERGQSFDWSRDNLREVELGIVRRAEDVASLARDSRSRGLSPRGNASSVERGMPGRDRPRVRASAHEHDADSNRTFL